MSVEQVGKLHAVLNLIDSMCVDPDVDIHYCIPGVRVTTDNRACHRDTPFIEFEYSGSDTTPHIHHIPLNQGYLKKEPKDLANLISFSFVQFMEEIDSRQYGAQ